MNENLKKYFLYLLLIFIVLARQLLKNAKLRLPQLIYWALFRAHLR